MASRARQNALSRIRRRNAKLQPNEQIKISRGMTTNQLKSLERTLDTKITLSKAGINTSNIKSLTSKERDIYSQVGRSLSSGNKTAIASSINKLARANRQKLTSVSNQLNKVKGFGSVEFIDTILTKKKFHRKSKMLPKDANTIINALTNEDYVTNTLNKIVTGVNKALELQGLDDIGFDEFDIDFTISELNKVPTRTKKFLVPDSDPERLDDIFDVLNEDEIDFTT